MDKEINAEIDKALDALTQARWHEFTQKGLSDELLVALQAITKALELNAQ